MSSDFQLEDTVFLPFTTRAFATGIPTVLAGTPAIDIYEDAGTTPVITGETLVVSLNSVVGFNMITVTATAASGFEAGKSYTAIIENGTVGGVSVVGEVVAHFTLDMSGAAKDLANATDGLGALRTLLLDVPTVAEFDARTILAAAYFDPAADAVANVTLVATTTTNTDMVGTDSAALASVCTEVRLATLTDWIDGGRLDLLLDAIKVPTDKLTFTVSNEVDSNVQSFNDTAVTGSIITKDDVGLLHFSTIGTPTSQTEYILDTAFSLDTLWVGNTVTVKDVSTGELFTTWIASAVQSTETVIVAAAPPFTVVATDEVRIKENQHPRFSLNAFDPPTATSLASLVTDVRGFFRLLFRSDAGPVTDQATQISDINNDDGAGAGTFDSTTDSVEAAEAAVAALNDAPAVSVSDILTTQMTESYSADGVAPTLAQALFLIQQILGDFSIAGTTLTVRKIDGATTAATFTLDDGTNPTDITRAT